MIKKLAKRLVYYLWILNGYIGFKLGPRTSQKLTVLITYYNPARLRHVNHQIRNLLKCEFVERVVISCHNPDVKIEEYVNVHDQRLALVSQSVRRACGYRWLVAREFSPEYLIVIDDDIVLFPAQLKVLFEHLITEPNIPHGLSGMIHMKNGDLQFRQRENIDVHYLCEIYAVTKEHVEQYFELVKIFEQQDKNLPEAIEYLGDFIVISQTGTQNPKIHKAGRIFRDETFNIPGVANHKEEQFSTIVNGVSKVVKELRPQFFV
jgi:hypothetical protein